MYARDHGWIATPIGGVAIEGDEIYLLSVRLSAEGVPVCGSADTVRAAAEQLEQWFAGERRDFDLPLAPPATARGAALRAGLIALPYGRTASYGEVAHALESSARAIGQLCARNPFPVIIPCHRVVNHGGRLGAYSAGRGPKTKSWLLDHERHVAGEHLL